MTGANHFVISGTCSLSLPALVAEERQAEQGSRKSTRIQQVK
jgi:hypothetical protein